MVYRVCTGFTLFTCNCTKQCHSPLRGRTPTGAPWLVLDMTPWHKMSICRKMDSCLVQRGYPTGRKAFLVWYCKTVLLGGDEWNRLLAYQEESSTHSMYGISWRFPLVTRPKRLYSIVKSFLFKALSSCFQLFIKGDLRYVVVSYTVPSSIIQLYTIYKTRRRA